MTDAPTIPTSKLLEFLKNSLPARQRVLIIPHDYPDPDALASAAAMELLLGRHLGQRSQIAFTGGVSRSENREMLRLIRYKWKMLSQVRHTTKKKVPCILVDTSPWSGNVTLPDFASPLVVVDHHPLPKKASSGNVFLDIHPGVGATATLMYEYLKESGIAVPKWMATVLVYAIITETMDLSRQTTERDVKAYTELVRKANLASLGRVRNAPLPRAYYAFLREAVSNALCYGRVAWTHLERVEQPEIVAEVADLLLRMERMTWAFCLAAYGDRLLVSLRSSQKGARCGALIRRVIGKDGAGGGHHTMAAGYIDVQRLSPEQVLDKKHAFIKKLVSKIEHRAGKSTELLELAAQPIVESAKATGGIGA